MLILLVLFLNIRCCVCISSFYVVNFLLLLFSISSLIKICILHACFLLCGQFLILFAYYVLQQSEIYDRIDQAVLLRQEQLLKTQALQSASLDGSARYRFLIIVLFIYFSIFCLTVTCSVVQETFEYSLLCSFHNCDQPASLFPFHSKIGQIYW